MWIIWTFVLLSVSCASSTYVQHSSLRCECNGRSRFCMLDALGLRCMDCQGDSAGRRCERCRAGFYQEGAEPSCTPCRCNATGSVSSTCDSRGRCSCRGGATGDKCDRCADGPITASGCSPRRGTREDSGSAAAACLCFGHSSSCSRPSGFSAHNISSTFTDGPDGWTVVTSEGHAPSHVDFRWSPTYKDLEVISRSSLPLYLNAPARYHGNQLLSYGQNFSFSLRLDRGARRPSTNDLQLEGGGLRVSSSLGDLSSVVPCGHKINYSFRLDELSSRWSPSLSSSQFQTLLQNLTSIKIRVAFGESGRGYLDDVHLVSARPGPGPPAPWVRTCSCPPGYEGRSCERCAAGYRRGGPADSPFDPCEPCTCRGGNCEDCLSADQTGAESCSPGFYQDPWRAPGGPSACVPCPCPEGVSCSVAHGSLRPQCDPCPLGTGGSACDVCQEGFHGDPAGLDGPRRPCRPCECNGHIDPRAAGSCERRTGECLRCVNNTKGRSCEACVPGFYRQRLADACKPCDCDVLGSESSQCDHTGRCLCRPGFEGLRCQRSQCPSCFGPIQAKVDVYVSRLTELQNRPVGGGSASTGGAALEAALSAAEELVEDLKDDAEELTEMEKRLQARLASVNKSQLAEGQNIQNAADKIDDIRQQHRKYNEQVEAVQSLIEDMRKKLDQAKANIQSAELPVGDAPLGLDFLTSLVKTASDLADKHKTTATAVERNANEALSDSEKSLDLARTLTDREKKVKEQIGELKNTLDQTSARVKGLDDRALRLSTDARDQSKMADDMLKSIANAERDIPAPLKGQVDDMANKLDQLKEQADFQVDGVQDLKDNVQQDMAAAQDLLNKGKTAQQKVDRLTERVDAAKLDTVDALNRINTNADDLDDALKTLRGFDQQLDAGRASADDAILRLPGINSTVRQAVRDNAETLSVLGDVSRDYQDAVRKADVLRGLVGGLEGKLATLPSPAVPLDAAAALRDQAARLKARASNTAGELDAELDRTKALGGDAEQAKAGAAAARNRAQQAGDAVERTLADIRHLLDKMKEPGTVDEGDLAQVEASLADAQSQVDSNLRPRLREALRREEVLRRRLLDLDRDLDSIKEDVRNLEEILASVPKGCYNSAPIEEA